VEPRLAFFGLVVSDIPKSLAFYRHLGLDIPQEADTKPHVDLELPGGLMLGELGYTQHKEPWDAFWGQRYAIVLDPDGTHVELSAALENRQS
jgi:hypothetical protein